MQLSFNYAMDTLAKRVKFGRKRLGLSQAELADASGLKQSDISKIETGKIQKTTGIAALAHALQCSPYWLDTNEGYPAWGSTGRQSTDESRRLQEPLPDDIKELAGWFDKLTEPGDRERAFDIAVAGVLKILAERAAERVARPTHKPNPTETLKIPRA